MTPTHKKAPLYAKYLYPLLGILEGFLYDKLNNYLLDHCGFLFCSLAFTTS